MVDLPSRALQLALKLKINAFLLNIYNLAAKTGKRDIQIERGIEKELDEIQKQEDNNKPD